MFKNYTIIVHPIKVCVLFHLHCSVKYSVLEARLLIRVGESLSFYKEIWPLCRVDNIEVFRNSRVGGISFFIVNCLCISEEMTYKRTVDNTNTTELRSLTNVCRNLDGNVKVFL